jgi:hypothetical protein
VRQTAGIVVTTKSPRSDQPTKCEIDRVRLELIFLAQS